jgi:hypothetical protein
MSTATKPTYLKVLNGLAGGEWSAHLEFNAWAKATRDETLRPLLLLVAAREGEHALSFEKRIIALGFTRLPRPKPNHEECLRVLGDPAMSDLHKMEFFGYGDGGEYAGETDTYAALFEDRSMDIETSELLGRYVGEERDTSRRMRAAYKVLQAQTKVAA